MPKTKFQEVIFTIIMVFFMVYAMICYNTALNIGEMKNEVFLSAFKELSFMGPIAFILDFFIIGHIAKKLAFKIVNLQRIILSSLYSQFLQFRLSLCVLL